MLREHVSGRGDSISFGYPAKKGRQAVDAIIEPEVRGVVRQLHRRGGGGEHLLAYWHGRHWHDVHSGGINQYLRELSGVDISAKDFRTWHATVLAAVALAVSEPAARMPTTARRRAVARAVREVADHLTDTPAVCRSSYINLRIIELFEDGVTISPVLQDLGEDVRFGMPATQGAVENAVLRLLQ